MPELTDFHNIVLANYLSYGAVVKIKFQTQVQRMREGHEERVGEWQDPLRQFDVAPVLRHQQDLDELVAFARARRGQKYAFRFRDPVDYSTIAMQFGVGDGVTTQFQLSKTYNSGITGDGDYYVRPIMLPEAGVQIFNNAVLQTSGVSVSLTTGVVTYTSAPANGVLLTWTGSFHVPVRFLNNGIYPNVETYQNYDVELPLYEQRSLISATIKTEIAVPDFVEARFPEQYAARSNMGPNFGVIIIPSDSGQESRVSQFTESKLRFEIENTHRSINDLSTILHFFLNRKGRLVGFRLKDVSDYSAVDEITGTGDGVETVFQLYKSYTSGGETQVRTITKPNDDVLFYLDDILASPQPTLDTETGLFTFASPVTDNVIITWTGTFDIPARFDNDELSLSITGFEDFNMNSMPFQEIMIDLPVVTIDEPSTIPVAIVSGCGVIPVPDRVAVRKYVEFFGGGNSGALKFGEGINFSFLNNIRDASSLTMAFLVSHVSVDSPQTLFSHFDYTQLRGFQFNIHTWGRSATAYATVGGSQLEPAFNGSSLSWECSTVTATEGMGTFRAKGILGADDSLRAYVITIDWANKKFYCSGSCSGMVDIDPDVFSNDTCLKDHVASAIDVKIGESLDISRYLGNTDPRFGGYFPEADGSLGAMSNAPSTGFSGGLIGRMYECFLLINVGTAGLGMLTPVSLTINSQHKPILRYWLSKYATGYPRHKSPNVSAAAGAWWRADEGITTDVGTGGEIIVRWEPAYVAGLGTNVATWFQGGTIGAGGDPKQLNVPILGLPTFPGRLYYANGKKVV